MKTLFFLLLMSTSVAAHEWYSPTCCSDKDCEPIPDTAVSIQADGYHVKYVGSLGFHVNVIVPFNKAHPSQDEHFHGCSSSDRFLCLYAPINT